MALLFDNMACLPNPSIYFAQGTAPASKQPAVAKARTTGPKQGGVPQQSGRLRTATTDQLNCNDLYSFNAKDKMQVLHHCDPQQWTEMILQHLSNDDLTVPQLCKVKR